MLSNYTKLKAQAQEALSAALIAGEKPPSAARTEREIEKLDAALIDFDKEIEKLCTLERQTRTLSEDRVVRWRAAALNVLAARKNSIACSIQDIICTQVSALAELVALEQAQRSIVGEAFTFRSGEVTQFWNAEMAVNALVKGLPPRLSPPRLNAANLAKMAADVLPSIINAIKEA